jgi:hypothetical protein
MKFNKVSLSPKTSGTVQSTVAATTALGGKGFARTYKSELYLLGLTNYVGEDTHHEIAKNRDDRFNKLVREAALSDMKWLLGFGGWLRGDIGMRSASLVLGVVAVRERTLKGLTQGNADLIDSVLQRADEPGQFIWLWRELYGRRLPKSVKKGVGRAVTRLYHERSYLRWDSGKVEIHFADVVDIVCPKPKDKKQSEFFRFLLDQRHHGDGSLDSMPVLAENARWRQALGRGDGHTALLDEDFIRDAGLKWENVLSAMGSKVDKRLLWEAMIPHMSYTALLRNLRNFDEHGVSDEMADKVIAKLVDPADIRGSKTFPMQIHAAYRATAGSLRWAYALERALKISLENVPALTGRTLIMVDTSSSMDEVFSKDGTVKRWDAAVLFGLALASRCESAEVVSFSSAQMYYHDPKGPKTKVFPQAKGEALLKGISRWNSQGFFLGGGTETAGALRLHFDGHDRVVILTDEQTGVDLQAVSDAVPNSVPMHTFNLAGYAVGHGRSGVRNRYTTGGLTDRAFLQIARIESGMSDVWPWEQ